LYCVNDRALACIVIRIRRGLDTKHDTYGNLEPCIITYVQIDDLSSANTQGIEDW